MPRVENFEFIFFYMSEQRVHALGTDDVIVPSRYNRQADAMLIDEFSDCFQVESKVSENYPRIVHTFALLFRAHLIVGESYNALVDNVEAIDFSGDLLEAVLIGNHPAKKTAEELRGGRE